MRKRTRMNGLVSHTTPSGVSYQSGKNKCEMGLKKCQKLLDEGYRLTGAKKVYNTTPREVVVSVFGGKLKMTFTEYQEKCQGFKILMEIF